MKMKIGIVDDHQLFLKSLSLMLETLKDYEVVIEAVNGADLQQKMAVQRHLPDIMLVDVNMPVMDGAATAAWLRDAHPSIRTVALSMNEKEPVIISMFKAGCCAYLLKDMHPATLTRALNQVYEKGYYNADLPQLDMRRLLKKAEKEIVLTPKEAVFLKLACSEMTYKHIAGVMHITERTVDGYREALFHKFEVQSRIGLCLEAIRKGYAQL